MSKNPYTPKTRAEFEAYARAMDEANDAVVKSATDRDKKKGASAKKSSPTAKVQAKKTGKK